MKEQAEKKFRVIIVGGSVAGLTLAHCLERTGIDYLVLEAYKDIAPQVGASIGLLPNGIRILDQLGLWDSIASFVEPTVRGSVWVDNGRLLLQGDLPELQQTRLAYPTAFLDRQVVLQILSERLPDPSKILVNKRIVSVEHFKEGAVVHCKDGSQFQGHVVVGADGIHSVIRNEMWRRFDEQGLSHLISQDRTAVTATYRCLFGISSPLPTLVPGDGHRVYNTDWSSLIVVGKQGRCYWFIFEKMQQVYHAPNVPRFSEEDVTEFVNTYLDSTLVAGTVFRDYWDRRISYGLLALEEAQHEHWNIDRLACIGDSIHKMTPHSGQGGNNAIESATALANSLRELKQLSAGAPPSLDEIRRVLTTYESSRRFRANQMVQMAGHHTRLEALATPKDRFLARHVLCRLGDALVDANCYGMVGATRFEGLPLPARSFTATMPFNPRVGLGHRESKLWRSVCAFPLVGLALYAQSANLHAIRDILSGSATINQPHLVSFLADLSTTQLIWVIESLRRGNAWTPMILGPVICGFLSQGAGIGMVAPLYYFIHHILTPQEKYLALDQRMVPTEDAKVIIPALFLGYVAPTVALLLPAVGGNRPVARIIWQLFPIWVTVLRRIFTNAVKQTSGRDRIEQPTKDVPYLRYAYMFSASISAIAGLYTVLQSPPMSQSFLIPSAVHAERMITSASGLYWEALQFWDLYRAKKLSTHWFQVLVILGATCVTVGPASAVALGWAWREQMMARGRPHPI
ncbi:monooxygenase [Dactylonectria macrodidyma]|uniref:Monooxygenase n=1 Tax=Dactylonectria macrodidyma TaxID=307937 RepID=A0A9P9F3Q9_9HYPO|nr:monooxygenase [Dactylonectria macrodidyma]